MMLSASTDPSKTEVLGLLPKFDDATILELGAGIGRYTRHFAGRANAVTAVDFVPEFLDLNRQATRGMPARVEYHCTDALELQLPANSFDFVFINWLLMYLDDEPVLVLLDRVRTWLRSGGALFLRESCVTSSNPDFPHPESHYRDGGHYRVLLEERFDVIASGNIAVYEKYLSNPNQLYWLCGAS